MLQVIYKHINIYLILHIINATEYVKLGYLSLLHRLLVTRILSEKYEIILTLTVSKIHGLWFLKLVLFMYFNSYALICYGQ